MCSVLVEPASLGAACGASLKELGVESTASSSSSSSHSAAVVTAPAVALPESCQRTCGDDCDEYASTAASSEPPHETVAERWADIAEFEDEQEESRGASSSQQPPAAVLPSGSPTKSRARWADLADSDEELSPQCATLPAIEEPEPSLQVAATAQSSCAAVPVDIAVVSTASTKRESKAEGKKQWSKRGARVEAPAADALEVARPMRQAGKSKASRWSSSSQEEWWPETQWGSKASNWWDSHSAEWWGSTAGAKGNKWSQQPWAPRGYATSKWQQGDGCSVVTGKPQCQFFVGIEEEPKFKVTRKILGPHGHHMKAIAEASGAKLRLRGRGSGFLEGPEQIESSDELMLCVSAPDWAGYEEAVRLVKELLEDVYEQYRSHCRRSQCEVPALEIRTHEGPRPGSR